MFPGKTYHPVKDRKGIAQSTIGLLCYNVQSIVICFNSFGFCNLGKVIFNVSNTDPSEIENLASGEDGRYYFMFFSSRQNENSMSGWLLEGFQKGIESC